VLKSRAKASVGFEDAVNIVIPLRMGCGKPLDWTLKRRVL
jgi:hypothetical protein